MSYGLLKNITFTGPTAARVYTIPDANATLLTTNAAVTVPQGGTGVASLTAYAVLCGGTTTTNPVQSIAGVGTLGQVLTSNGAGALPTFQNATGVAMTVSGAGFTALPVPPAAGLSVQGSLSGAPNTYFNYIEARAATGNAIYIVGLSCYISIASGTINYVTFQIGTGAAASETSVSQFSISAADLTEGREIDFPAWIPVGASTRVAVQAADNNGDSVTRNTYRVILRTIDQANVS